MSGRARTCPVCGRSFVPRVAHQKNCTRACTIHAASRRFRGLDPAQPGYRPDKDRGLGDLIAGARARMDYAISRGRWEEAQAFEAAEKALKLARSARKKRLSQKGGAA